MGYLLGTVMEKLDLRLRYGEEFLPLPNLPGVEVELYLPEPFPGEGRGVEELVEEALAHPVGSEPLRELVRRVHPRNPVIIVSDYTRNCHYPESLPVVLRELSRGGLKPRQLTILVGGGSHRPMVKDQLAAHLGREVLRRVGRVVVHDPEDESSHVSLGRTDRGTLVHLNRLAADADFLMITGSITYHYFAGFSGGRKGLFPAVGATRSIVENHRLAIDPVTGDFHPMARAGILKGNPVHEDLMDVCAMARPDFMLDVIEDASGGVGAVVAGDYSYAHRRGCTIVEEHFGRLVPEVPYDLVIASCGGHPRDVNFYQAHKVMENCARLVRDGGSLVLVARCEEGMGHTGFADYREMASSHRLKEMLRHGYRPLAHLVLALVKKTERIHVVMVSELDPAEVSPFGVVVRESLPAALQEAFTKAGQVERVAVVPFGLNLTFIGKDQLLPRKEIDERKARYLGT